MSAINPPSSKKKNAKLVSKSQQTIGSQLVEYLQGVKKEWTKISWPKGPQIWAQTIVVLIMVSLMTLGLFVLDYSLHFVIKAITPH
jgi:preprotein translocase SecE subunit